MGANESVPNTTYMPVLVAPAIAAILFLHQMWNYLYWGISPMGHTLQTIKSRRDVIYTPEVAHALASVMREQLHDGGNVADHFWGVRPAVGDERNRRLAIGPAPLRDRNQITFEHAED